MLLFVSLGFISGCIINDCSAGQRKVTGNNRCKAESSAVDKIHAAKLRRSAFKRYVHKILLQAIDSMGKKVFISFI